MNKLIFFSGLFFLSQCYGMNQEKLTLLCEEAARENLIFLKILDLAKQNQIFSKRPNNNEKKPQIKPRYGSFYRYKPYPKFVNKH